MNSKSFSSPFNETPKVIKQDYSLELQGQEYISSDDDYEESDDESEEEEWEDERIGIDRGNQPVVVSKCSSDTSTLNATEYMNKMTLDLMMNPHYLSKANPEAYQKKVEQAHRILRHRREIYKTMDNCFDALEKLTSNNRGKDEIDLDVQTGFLHFAKTVLLNIQQQHAGKSEKEPIFSVCNDIYSSFYPEDER